jgi:predicted Zn-dependent peptidase
MPLKHSVEEVQLENGMRGLLIDVPGTSVVSYEIHFLAGNYFSPSTDVQQTAHILEHMAFGGTKQYPSQEEFSQVFSKNGAYQNATTWQYEMSYYADCALLEWDRILDLQKDAITGPLLTEDVMKSEKGNVREELTGQANNRRRILWQNVMRAMGDEMFLDEEKVKTIDAVTLANVKQHYNNTHTLNNMRFSIAGDLKKHKDEIIAQLETWDLPAGSRLVVPTMTSKSSAPVSIYKADMPSVMFAIMMTLHRKYTEEEKIALSILNHILTGTHHSRILGKARKQGLCYGMNSSAGSDSDGISRFEMGGQVSAENAQPLYDLIAEELSNVVKGGITETELNDAKQYYLGIQQMNGQTVGSINGWYSSLYFDDGIIDYMEDEPRYINGVTLEAMQKLLNELLQTSNWTVGIIGAMRKPAVKKLYDTIAKQMHQR